MILTHTYNIATEPKDYHIWYVAHPDYLSHEFLIHSIEANAEGEKRDCTEVFSKASLRLMCRHIRYPVAPLNQLRGQLMPIPFPLPPLNCLELEIPLNLNIKQVVRVQIVLNVEVREITG